MRDLGFVRRMPLALSSLVLVAATALSADKDVVVVNTPAQPVPTTVQGNVNVNIKNTPASPVPVKNVFDPAQAPFADIKSVDFADGEAQKDTFFDPVPLGKRLVIETVTARAQAKTGQAWDLYIGTPIPNSPGHVHHVVTLSAPSDFGSVQVRTATLPVRLYVEPGGQVRVFAHRQNGDAGMAGVDVTISGYFVTLP